VGERVRIRRASRGYQVGDQGTVLEGPASNTADDQKSYVAAMDKDGPGCPSIVFGADEIQPDN
jgi:hypothetical protein